MFEKEADEYSNNWRVNKNTNLNFAELVELRAVIYKANKDGAEFGYNKANEEMQEQIEATYKLFEENKELKELVEKYRQAIDKCLHITFMGGGCEVNTIGQYATLVDGYLTDVEGLAKWKN